MLEKARRDGVETAWDRHAEDGAPVQVRDQRPLLPELLHGTVPRHRRPPRKGPRHLRRHGEHDRGQKLRPHGGRRDGGAQRPRPERRRDAPGGGHRQGAGLLDPRPPEAQRGGPDLRNRRLRENHRAARGSRGAHGALRVREVRGRAALPQARAGAPAEVVERDRHRPARRGPRSHRDSPSHHHGR